MNKMYLGLLTALAISGLATSQALAKTYLQNNYGYPIKYVENTAKEASAMYIREATTSLGAQFQEDVKKLYPEKEIGNGVRVPVGGRFPSLSIRTDNGNFTDISNKLEEAKSKQKLHPKNDVIIYITPGKIYGWYIEVQVESNTILPEEAF